MRKWYLSSKAAGSVVVLLSISFLDLPNRLFSSHWDRCNKLYITVKEVPALMNVRSLDGQRRGCDSANLPQKS